MSKLLHGRFVFSRKGQYRKRTVAKTIGIVKLRLGFEDTQPDSKPLEKASKL